MRKLLTLLILTLAPLPLAQTSEVTAVSLSAMLQDDGRLLWLEPSAEPETIDGFGLTLDYRLEVQNPDGSSAPLRLWLAGDPAAGYAPFVSLGYYGPFDASGGQALGYLYAFAAVMCLGMDEAMRDEIGAYSYGFFPTVTESWRSDARQFGDYYVTVGGAVDGDNVNLLLDIETVGTPGTNGWQIVCALEP